MLGAVRVTPESLENLVINTAQQYGVDPNFVRATIKQESNWDVNASRYEQHLGDTSWGLMQVLLKTAKMVLGNDQLTIQDLIKPEINIAAGTKYLGMLLNQTGNQSDASAAYNAGSVKMKDGKYINQDYVDSVRRYYLMYQTLGPAASLLVTQSNPMINIWILGVALVVGIALVSRR